MKEDTMNDIKQYFENYKKRRALPKLEAGTAKTIKDFYDRWIEPTLISRENALAWHKMLMQYIKRDDAIFLLRRYENGTKIEGKWNTRRSAMTRFMDGFTYVFVSNFDAHEIYNMAFKGVVPTAEEFASLLNNYEYPMHYDDGKSQSCEEIFISAYPHIGSVRGGVLNESNYYLAHIHSVNGAGYAWNEDGTVISKEEIKEIAPRGTLSDWDISTDHPIRKFDYSLTDKQKAYVIAHFLRLVDPLNHFLTPVTRFTSVKNIPWKENTNIGECPVLVGYVSKVYEQRFGKDYINTYCKAAMTSPMDVNQSDLGEQDIEIIVSSEKKKKQEKEQKIKQKKVSGKKTTGVHLEQVPIILEPQDVEMFKNLLLKKRKAEFKITYSDGRIEIKQWNARAFTEESDILNNIRSKTWWRKKDTLGIVKVEVTIDN